MLDRTPNKHTVRRRQARRRNRDYRRRVCNGEIVVPVTVGADALDLLIRLHWLQERDADDRDRIGAAISRLLNASE